MPRRFQGKYDVVPARSFFSRALFLVSEQKINVFLNK